jgi:hypothetical protein
MPGKSPRQKNSLQGKMEREKGQMDRSGLQRITIQFSFLKPIALGKWIEHCDNCKSVFLRAFYDGEGSISGHDLSVYNTERDLLVYIRCLLDSFDIETLPLGLMTRAGTSLTDPKTGKTYFRKTIASASVLELEAC